MTRSTPWRSLRLITGLLATAGVATAVTAAALPSSADTLDDDGIAEVGGLAPTVTSSNVKKIAGIPETTAISMEFARTGAYAYVSSLDTISVLDLTDPRDPRVRGTLTQALFENEAMTYGERVKNGELTRFVIAAIDLYRVSTDDPDHVHADDGPQIAIIDVTDPDRPFTRSVTDVGEVTSSTHTVQCVDQADCRYAYTAGNRGKFSVLDLSDL
ncbi:MAG: hypothetical protein M3P31_03905, partial [Actinomycetota bacterium]|nr:hypothetical protein [Actinomycetota bacterium]